MSLLDSIPANGQTAAAPAAPAKSSGGSLLDALAPNKGFKSAAPASTGSLPGGLPAPAASGPINFGALSMVNSIPHSPEMTPPNQKFMPAPGKLFATTDARGTSYGPSDQKDSSGLPYLSYRNPGDTATTTDLTRVDTAFDPRIAAPVTTGSFTTPRAVANRAAVKAAMGGSYSTELDHVISLELGGSNNKANLQIESAVDPSKPYSGSNQTATDPIENQLAKEVISGKKSLFQAQFDLAKIKGTPVPYIGEVATKYAEQAYNAGKAADYANSPIGLTENTIGQIGNWTNSIIQGINKYTTASDSNPLPDWLKKVIAHPVQAGQGVVQAGVEAVGFTAGIGDAIINKGLNPLFGIPNTPETTASNAYSQIAQMNTDLSETRSPDQQEAYDTGNFIGWMIPYSEVSHGVNAVVDASKITTYMPKIAPLIPYISNTASFLGTGQILHTPDEGSRVQQLKNDTMMLGLFELTPIFGKTLSGMAKRGLGDMLAPDVKAAASAALKPVVETLHDGGTVTADELDHATTRAKTIIEDATGKTPQQLVQQHFEFPTESKGPANSDVAAQKYWDEKLAPELEAGKPIVIGADDLKDHFGGDYATESHAKYSQAAFKLYDRALKENKDPEVALLGGGPGSGKTELITNRLKSSGFKGVIYDSNLSNYDGAVKQIEAARTAGKDVKIFGVTPDLERARGFTIDREAQNGRGVTDRAFARGHAGFPDVIQKLLENKIISPDDVHLYDTRGVTTKEGFHELAASGSFSKDPLAHVKSLGYNEEHVRSNYSKESVAGRSNKKLRDSGVRRGVDHISQENRADQGGGKREVKLAEFPQSGRPLLGVAFPGANYIARFIEKDIIEKFAGARDAITGIYKASKDLFAPNVERGKAAAVVGSTLMKVEKYASAAWKVSENRRDWWAKMSEDDHYQFIDNIETGYHYTPNDFTSRYGKGVGQTMADLANEYRDRLNTAFKFEEDAGLKKNYITDYFPHMWTDAEEAKTFFQNFVKSFGKGYGKAYGSFQNLRTMDLIKAGREAGLTLVTSNPEELVLMREIDGQRVAAKIEMMNELQHEGLAHETASTQYGSHAKWPIMNGVDHRQWAVAPDAAKILNTAFFSKSLWSDKGFSGKIFRGIMAVKGTVTPIKLSLSLFHPIHIAFIDSSSERARLWEGMIKGNMSPGDALAAMAKPSSLVSQVTDTIEYGNITKLWDTPMEKLNDRQRTVIQYIIDGGGSPKMSEEFKIRASDGFKKALADENYLGAAIRGLPKVIEGYQKPFFETYIPALKVGSYIKGVEELLRTNPELATNDVARKVAFRQVWQSMDNRFGQMVYKSNFWSPFWKEVGQASFLSLGWNAGFVREFGGGALDLVKLSAKLAGKPLGLAKPTLDDVTQKMLFSIDYTLQAAAIGGLMTYAMTGKMPHGAQDLFFPNTGKTNPDGSPARLNTSFYTREYFSFANHIQKQGAIGGTLSSVQNKMSPVLNTLADVFSNKDFYGYQIHDTTQDPAKQAEQVLAYLITNNLNPISVAGAQNAAQTTGRLGEALSYAGFNPAPKYISESPMQTKIFSVLDQRTGGTKPLEAKPAADAKANIRKLYEKGNVDDANKALDAAVKAGYVSAKGKGAFISSLDIPSDVRAFKSLAQFPSDQENLLAQMDEKDLARYADYAASTVKSHLSSLSPAAKQFVADLQSGKIHLAEFKAGKEVPAATK